MSKRGQRGSKGKEKNEKIKFSTKLKVETRFALVSSSLFFPREELW